MNSSTPTQQRILGEARRLFAEHGYAGTSIRDITSAAKANLGAVTYHFGSKEALYQAVFMGLAEPFARRVVEAAGAADPPLDRIERIVRAYFTFFAEHPDLPKLMTHQLVLSGPFPPPFAQLQATIRSAIVGVIQAGQADGSIRRGNPVALALSIVAQPAFVFIARRAVTHVAGFDIMQPDVLEAVVQHVAAFTRRGLATDSGESRS